MEHTHDKENNNKNQALANSLTSKATQNKAIELQDNRPPSFTILQKKINNTGLPDNLKSGIENLSGHSMNDVKVHYNSSQPAQLNAHAYAQGTDIHIASGQEKHLPHEAWHVVQQKQGRVKPTLQMKGKVNVNDDKGLENEADVMGAKSLLTNNNGNNSNKIIQNKIRNTTTEPIQMVHPAFNDFNFWRPNQLNLETGEYEAHPMSPEGKKKDLTSEFGAEVMKLILYTDLPSEEAVERENLTRQFFGRGGNPWDAYYLLNKYPLDNSILKTAFNYYITKKTELVAYTSLESKNPQVTQLKLGYKYDSINQIHDRIKSFLNIIKGDNGLAPMLHPELIALNILLKEKLQTEKGTHVLLYQKRTKIGANISLYGDLLQYNGRAKVCAEKVIDGLFGSKFIRSRRPPLRIRINVNPGISKAIADTRGIGSFITINIDQYQLEEFSAGQLLGLLAHEVGVHSLDSTTLTDQEQAAEEHDKNSKQQGQHGGKQYAIEKQIGAPKQQYDHLTIGRGILGQVSAAPRLNMYEKTIISIIDALNNEDDRKETAATYCIDIARILVLNDNSEGLADLGYFQKINLGLDIVSASVNEWTRMKAKYGATHPIINTINIGSVYITSCLFTLNKLIAKVQSEGV
jgi:hypothetical protein